MYIHICVNRLTYVCIVPSLLDSSKQQQQCLKTKLQLSVIWLVLLLLLIFQSKESVYYTYIQV